MATAREELARTLRESRMAAGFTSQGNLAGALHVSRPVITRAESAAHPIPSHDLLVAWARVTGLDLAKLTEIVERARTGSPEWFMPYEGAEARASVIRCWAPFVVPGLGQTRAYMRALFEAEGHPPDRVDELTKARLERQAVIGRARVTMIIGQQVLSWPIGSPAVMAEQCAQLAALAQLPNVALHVLPQGRNMGLWGALDIAAHGSTTTVCLTTLKDVTSTASDLVEYAIEAFERLLGAAQPREESLALVRALEEQWNAQV